jgi:hypothetical protein
MSDERYFIAHAPNKRHWTEVTRADFVRHERIAGFYPKSGDPNGIATAAFSNETISGQVCYGGGIPESADTVTVLVPGKPSPTIPPRPWAVQNCEHALTEIKSFTVIPANEQGVIEVEINEEHQNDEMGGQSIFLTEEDLHTILVKVLESKVNREVKS